MRSCAGNAWNNDNTPIDAMSAKKKLVFLTATRADFGKLKPLIREVDASPNFDATIFATGMHMLARYGSTLYEIRKSGFKNIFTYINQNDSVDSRMDFVLANTIQGFGHYIREFRPDMIVVHGDRIEALAGATVGALNNILVGHIEGGEISGTVDELLRHTVTKLSRLHFVANEEARNRLIQMGEENSSVFVIGSPDIDVMLSDELPPLSRVQRKYGIRFKDYAIFIYHPVTTELTLLKQNIHRVLDALISSCLNFVVIYPNNDTGSEIIMEAMGRLQDNRHFRILPSVRFEYFLALLKNTAAIVGNSSAGIREAPVYGVPTINIGTRQKNRFNYDSIINVAEDSNEILKAIRNLPGRSRPSLHFGRGDSAKRFMECLRRPEVWKISPQKQFRDLKPQP
jgi:UDP-N-acetylglucosamine 2-epimerase (hydrolysing)